MYFRIFVSLVLESDGAKVSEILLTMGHKIEAGYINQKTTSQRINCIAPLYCVQSEYKSLPSSTVRDDLLDELNNII